MKRGGKGAFVHPGPKGTALKSFYRKSRKKKIFEWLAAFIGGGWLILEFVHWILIDHYHLPEIILDATLVGLLIALAGTMAWRWFRGGREPRQDISFPAADGMAPKDDAIPVPLAPGRVWRGSIAVLPFADLSAGKDQGYFCDGMAEEIINALTKIRDLRIVARTSAFSFKGQDIDIREIGRKLGVGSILEGSVRKAGDRLRISAQLIQVLDGCHLWSETFDRKAEDIFAIQDEIAAEIVKKLRVDQGHDLPCGLAVPRTANLNAYHLFLRGHELGSGNTEEGLRGAIDCYERALVEEPGYAQAYAGLARAYFYLGFMDWPPEAVFPKAKEMAARALEENPRLAQAHSYLGASKLHYDRDWEGAKASILTGLGLNPQDADAHAMYSWLLMAKGEMTPAIGEVALAIDLDPLSTTAWAQIAACKMRVGEFADAEKDLRRILKLQPDRPFSLWLLGHAHVLQGQFREGLAGIRRALTISGGNSLILAGLGWALAVAGRRDGALAALQELRGQSGAHYVRPYLFAKIHGALGENDQAFSWLARAFETHDPSLPFIMTDETMRSLRSDRRFAGLLERMNLVSD